MGLAQGGAPSVEIFGRMRRAAGVLPWLLPLLAGSVLRFRGLGFGLPGNLFRPDEQAVVNASLAMAGGRLRPDDYMYPTFFKYLLALLFRIRMGLGAGTPPAHAVWQSVASAYFVDGSPYYLLARAVGAAFGAATILATYRIAREGYGRWAGFGAASFLAVSTLHVRDSHFGVTDVTSAALLTFSLVAIARIARRERLTDYLTSGVLLGLAASTKYGAAVGLVPLLVAHLCRRPAGAAPSRWMTDRRLALALAACLASFALTSPFVLLNARQAFRDVAFQAGHLVVLGHEENLGRGWLYHPRVSLYHGLGAAAFFLSLAGVILFARRRAKTDLVLLSFTLAYFAVCAPGKTVFFRYVIPLLPVLCVLAAAFLVWLAETRLPARVAAAGGAPIFLVLAFAGAAAGPARSSAELDRLFSHRDTRAEAREWIEAHVPEGQLILNVGGLFGDVQLRDRMTLGWWLARYLEAFPETDERELVDYLELQRDRIPPYYGYQNSPATSNLETEVRGSTDLLANPDFAWVVTHEHPLSYSRVDPAFEAELKKDAVPAASFSPGSPAALARAIYDRQDAFYYPLARMEGVERGGPEVKIWRVEGRAGFLFGQPHDLARLFADAFLMLGNDRMEMGTPADAAAYYVRSLNLYSGRPRGHMFLGVACLMQDQLDEAARELGTAMSAGVARRELETYVVSMLRFRGDLLQKLGDVYVRLGDPAGAARVRSAAAR